ncbi:MAG: HAD family phosphatase [Lachnospiraceae bacterium]|nr:HAD family phosphatase [Lachnospiraceae bacterium]
MLKNIVFDMGKVVLDYTSWGAVRHYTQDPAMQRKIVNAVFYSTEWMVLDCGFRSEESCLAKMLTHLDTEEERELASLAFRDWPLYNIWPNPGMGDFVHELKEDGYQIYLFSNASVRMRDHIDRLLPHSEDWSGYLFSAEIGYVKPQREFFTTGYETFGIRPEESFFIDDLPENVAGAAKTGMQGYIFDNDIPALKNAITAFAAK